MESKAAAVRIGLRGIERLRQGYPWIFAADVEYVPAGLPSGAAVEVCDLRGRFLAMAFYSEASQIRLRILGRQRTAIDAGWFRQRLQSADALRQRLFAGESTYRVLHGEADGVPGLVVDRFGDYIVMQCLVAATDQRRDLLAQLLAEHFGCRAIVERSDAKVREREGLKPRKEVVVGELAPTVTYHEGDIELEVDLLHGQKTGAFLDQRENHQRAADYAYGEALDCFSYVGGFALQMARVAERVTAVEIGAAACAQIRANARRNRLRNVEVVEANAFDYLRQAVDAGRRFDCIVLDPPSFAKSKDSTAGALRGYKEINLRAMQLLRPGGTLISASCTYHVDEPNFVAMLESAAADAKRQVQVLEKRGAGRDHPVLLGLRESQYLKCFMLRVV